MRKVSKNITSQVGPVRMHLNDLREMVRCIQELGGNEPRLRIVVDDFELTSLDEVAQLGRRKARVFEINYMSFDPRSISFSAYVYAGMLWLRCSSDEALARGVFSQVETLSLARVHLWWRALQFISRFISLLSAVFALAGVLFIITGQLLLLVVSAASMLAGLLVAGANLAALFWSKSEIILVDKGQNPSFYERNKDKIWVEIIKALATFVLGIIATLIFQNAVK